MTTSLLQPRARRAGAAKKLILASVAAALIGSLLVVAQATAEVKSPRSIEAFYGRDLVLITGYPAGTQVKIDVLRGPNAALAGSVTGTTGAAGTEEAGTLEINHTGAGDCWNPPATPDIMPGDTVRTTVLGGGGVPTQDTDSTVVRDVGLDLEAIRFDVRAGTITVKGHARSLPNAPIAPGADTLELRLNKANADNRWDVFPGGDQEREGRRDLRVDIGGDLNARGNFTRVLNVGTDDARDARRNGVDQIIEWSPAPAGAEEEVIPEITVFDEDEGVPPGCPDRAEYGITGTSAKVINETSVNRNLIVRGVSFGATAINVSVPGGAANPATITPSDPAAPELFQTWRATIPAAEIAALRQGNFAVRAVYSGDAVPTRPSSVILRKDTVEPGKPVASPKPGVYAKAQSVTLRAQAGSQIRYTVNGARPTAGSRLYVRPIRVSATQTIKAIAIDQAGNTSPVAGFRYIIR